MAIFSRAYKHLVIVDDKTGLGGDLQTWLDTKHGQAAVLEQIDLEKPSMIDTVFDRHKTLDALICCTPIVDARSWGLLTADALEARVKRKLWGQIHVALRAHAAIRGRRGLITLTSGSETAGQDAVPARIANAALERFVSDSARQDKDICINIVRASLQVGATASDDAVLAAYSQAIRRGDSGQPIDVT